MKKAWFALIALCGLLCIGAARAETPVSGQTTYPEAALEKYWQCKERTDLESIRQILWKHQNVERVDASIYGLPPNDFDDHSLLTVDERLWYRKVREDEKNPLPTEGPIQYPHFLREAIDRLYIVNGTRPNCALFLEGQGVTVDQANELLQGGWASDKDLTSGDSNARGEIHVTMDRGTPGRVLVSSCPASAAETSNPTWHTADYGATWTKTVNGNNSGSTWECDPFGYYQRSTGNVYQAKIGCNTGSCGATYVMMRKSTDNGATWADCGRPDSSATTSDREQYAIDNTPTSACYGNLYITWHNSNAEQVSVSSNSCSTWTKTQITSSGSITPDVGVGADGHVYVVWGNYGTSQFMVAGSANCGSTWNSPSNTNVMAYKGAWSNNVPAQCTRGISTEPLVDVDRCPWSTYYNRVYVMMADYEASGTDLGCSPTYSNTHNYELWLSYSDDYGVTWHKPSTGAVGADDITSFEGATVDDFFPWMRVDETDGAVYVSWTRSRLAPTSLTDRQITGTWAMRSLDGGKTWSAPYQVSSVENSERTTGYNSFERGDYQAMDVYQGVLYPVWIDRRSPTAGSQTAEHPITRKVCTEPAHKSERSPSWTAPPTTAGPGAAKVINVSWALPDIYWGDGGENTAARKFQLWVDGALYQDNISALATSTTYTAADCATLHTFVIRAINSCAVYKDYVAATAKATGCCVSPGAPTLTGAVGDCYGVNLTWTPGTGVTNSYNVYRSATPGGPYTIVGTAPTTTGTSYSDTTAASGAPYYYVVRGACDAAGSGESGNSNELSAARTLNPIPTITGASTNSCPSTTVVLTTEAGQSSYQWYLGGSPIGGATSNTYTATASGTYTVSYVNNLGCAGLSAGKAVTIVPCAASIVYQSHGTITQVTGDGDAWYERGEKWSVSVTLTNAGNMPASNVTATFGGNGITVCSPTASFGTIPVGGTATATFQFVISPTFSPCGGAVNFSVTGKTSTEYNPAGADENNVFNISVGQFVAGGGSSTQLAIQPTTADSYVNQISSTTNYGTAQTMYTNNRTSREEDALMQFDLSGIPANSTITAATLELYEYSGPTVSYTLNVNRNTASWLEASVTWATKPAYDATVIASLNPGTATGWKTWTITSLVQAWYAGTYTNYGITLRPATITGSTNYYYQFATKEYNANTAYRPILRVTYNPPVWDCSYTGAGTCCGAVTTPTNNTAADPDMCADGGVQIGWAQDVSDWGDGGSGARTYDILRNGTAIATGIAYGTTTYTDNTGVNGTTCAYTVRYNNGCGATATTTGASAADNATICTALDQCHDVGTCDPQTGVCTNPAKIDGTTCNDGDACTQTDACQKGTCTGSNPVICTALDQCHDIGVCNTGTGACSNPPKTNGTTCDDSNACTQTDACQNGTCTGSNPVICTALDQCHDIGTCDTGTGVCSNPAKVNGTTCNDGDGCTQTDACQNGVCTGSNPVVCTALDQCHDAGVCNPTNGLCSNPAKTNGTTCDDGDLCTQSDTCQNGACVGDNPVVCTALDQCHDVGACNPTTGVCSNPPKTNGTTCNDGDLCTQTDSCQNGACVGSNPMVCTALDQCHDPGVCNPASGLCSNPPKTNGATCDDGDACTQTDACQDGACVGANPVTCTALDQCHNAGVCNPTTGGCSNPAQANGATCNDGDLCTQVDTCQNGACVGDSPVVCTALDQCHDVGTCDPQTGVCSNPAKTDGAACNDGNLCTQTDACQNGVCVGASPVVCAALDQCHDAGVCDPQTGLCSNPPKTNGTVCSDGDACTQIDTCQDGACVGANPVACTALDQCHNAGTCDPQTGACSNPAKANGTTCDDSDLCTQVDTCQNGSCVGDSPVVCTALDQCHEVGTCDPQTGQCSNPAKTNGTTCNDGDLCTQADACQNGVCVGSNPVVCAALDQCHDAGVCNPADGLCSSPPKTNGTVCSDGDACTQTDTCQDGACVGANPVACTALDQCHNAGTCDPPTGACSNPAKPNGTVCNDGDLCTQVDTCQSGSCVGDSPVVCTASDQCHDVGTCDPQTGQCSNPAKTNGTTCNDGDLCTQTDACQNGACVGTSPVVCTALDQCHDPGVCNPANGLCSNPPKTNGTVCSDGDACTQTDTCQDGACVGANPVACTALDQCHNAGTCDPQTGACSNPAKANGTVCNDGDLCTQVDTCQNGTCTGDSPVVCPTPDQCHDAGTCNPTTGQCSNPAKANGTTCNDGDLCTQTDACENGACVGANPVVCTALDQCHEAGSCNPATGACSNPAKPNGTTCNDGDLCTQADACENGACVGANPVTCTALDQCHEAGSCNPATGACSNPAKPNGTTCNDGDLCTQTDACESGACVGSNPVACTALDQCHEAGSCNPATGVCSNPPKPNGASCNDANPCTQTDACENGACIGANTVVCTALDQCHDAGVCSPATGVCSNPPRPNGSTCDDGDPCTAGDTCAAGVCGGAPVGPPAEVNDTLLLTASGPVATLSWSDGAGAFGVYRGAVTSGSLWTYNHTCFDGAASGSATDPSVPAVGVSWYYLVTRKTVCGESIPGRDSGHNAIPNATPCP